MGNTGEYTHAQSTRTRGHHRDSSDSAAMNEPHLLRRQLLSHSLRCVTPRLEPLAIGFRCIILGAIPVVPSGIPS